jgi:rare lipoprotein A
MRWILLMMLMALLAACGESGQEALTEANFVQRGEASFYSDKLEGRPTASGEPFSQKRMTAAHRYLPIGTVATVTHRETGHSIKVRINDRGPFSKKRIIDLSARARDELGFDKDRGVIQVTVKAQLAPDVAAQVNKKLNDNG